MSVQDVFIHLFPNDVCVFFQCLYVGLATFGGHFIAYVYELAEVGIVVGMMGDVA